MSPKNRSFKAIIYAQKTSAILLLAFAVAMSPVGASAGKGMSRRGFLSCVALTGAAAVGGYIYYRSNSSKWNPQSNTIEVDPQTEQELVEKIQAGTNASVEDSKSILASLKGSVGEYVKVYLENEPKRKDSYLDSVAKAHMLMIAQTLSTLVVRGAGGKSGNAGLQAMKIDDILRNQPSKIFIPATVIAPIYEELLYRLLPYSVFGNSWTVGTLSSFVFAYAHNRTSKGFDIKTIPLPQFLAGLVFWYLLDTKGLSHSIVAHASLNTTAMTMMWLGANYGSPGRH